MVMQGLFRNYRQVNHVRIRLDIGLLLENPIRKDNYPGRFQGKTMSFPISSCLVKVDDDVVHGQSNDT